MEGKNNYIISSGSQSESAEPEITIYENPVYLAVKRCFDIVFSLLCIIVFTIPILFVMLLIVIDSPGASPIYTQYRVGKNGRVFKFYKLRSMVPEADQMLDSLLDQNEMEGPAFKISNDPRITRVGRVIRRTCIDELPQLWNILKGDMSFVGPRPPLPREVEQYNDFQRNRLSVVPGLTCYWQIQPNRNSLTFDKWLELDLKYIEERNVKTDLMIIFKTVGAVLKMEGV
ncbi:MAG TPA: sugar transferase [Oscillospiraceae bacterium]|nr:sugar transferase [Oscillospiraceae bacterium]